MTSDAPLRRPRIDRREPIGRAVDRHTALAAVGIAPAGASLTAPAVEEEGTAPAVASPIAPVPVADGPPAAVRRTLRAVASCGAVILLTALLGTGTRTRPASGGAVAAATASSGRSDFARPWGGGPQHSWTVMSPAGGPIELVWA